MKATGAGHLSPSTSLLPALRRAVLNRALAPGPDRARARRTLRTEAKEVVELLVLGTLAFAAIVIFAVLASVFGVVMWLVFLPFRIVGWLFHLFGALLAIPFVLAFGVVAVVALGAGMSMFVIPFLPIALIALGAWWLVRRNRRSAQTVTS